MLITLRESIGIATVISAIDWIVIHQKPGESSWWQFGAGYAALVVGLYLFMQKRSD